MSGYELLLCVCNHMIFEWLINLCNALSLLPSIRSINLCSTYVSEVGIRGELSLGMIEQAGIIKEAGKIEGGEGLSPLSSVFSPIA